MLINAELQCNMMRVGEQKCRPGGWNCECVYGADTVTDNYVQFWSRRFRSGIFDIKVAPRTGRPILENVDKITEIIEVDQHVSNRTIAQELKIDYKQF
ncbi:histone-lysine N-methyltransferase SETMAR [Trichonephila clavipes]|uniref:Histone-lysine N-methyltransferase SETMAR n=1 Tax=Trichonephila clavipes TaxID=2585209 RepID=A0A8X6SK84_TRICX|nr:histone-lysine N-methyltransferase SETMAR [Trichonephila clavipes]